MLTVFRNATLVLIYNQPGDRDALQLLRRLFAAASIETSPLHFDTVIFCPNLAAPDSKITKGMDTQH